MTAQPALAQVPASCPHGLGTPASCVDCMYDGPVAPPTTAHRPTVVVVFRARYGGDCAECDLPLHPGERIAELTSGRYVHEHCAP